MAAAVARLSPPPGRYPLERLANEFGVDWGDLVLIAHSIRFAGAGGILPDNRKLAVLAAGARLMQSLGRPTTFVLFQRIKVLVEGVR